MRSYRSASRECRRHTAPSSRNLKALLLVLSVVLRWTSTRATHRSAGSWLCRCWSAFGDAVSDEHSFLVWSSGAPMLGFGISAFTAGSSAETLMPSIRPAALSIPDAALRNLYCHFRDDSNVI